MKGEGEVVLVDGCAVHAMLWMGLSHWWLGLLAVYFFIYFLCKRICPSISVCGTSSLKTSGGIVHQKEIGGRTKLFLIQTASENVDGSSLSQKQINQFPIESLQDEESELYPACSHNDPSNYPTFTWDLLSFSLSRNTTMTLPGYPSAWHCLGKCLFCIQNVWCLLVPWRMWAQFAIMLFGKNVAQTKRER